MAKLTGQFTTPSLDAQNNKTHKPFLHGVVFVFTGATKVTRETDAKGKYSFDLANGEYEVSVYLKGNTEKDRFDMRAGEKFTVTATTQADALEKWLQVIGTSGKDELATYYENLLAQMQKVANDFKDETQADGAGLFVKQGSVRKLSLSNGGIYIGSTIESHSYHLKAGEHGLAAGEKFSGLENLRSIMNESFCYFQVCRNGAGDDTKNLFAIFNGYRTQNLITAYSEDAGITWSKASMFYGTHNTIVDSNGNLKAASPVLRLFNDRIETNDQFMEKPIFEKLGTGTYKISNTLGLAQEGWTYEKPRGSDGQPYFRVVVEKLEDGCIVRVHDEYDTVEKAEITDIDGNTRTVDKIVKILGQARDIKEHERWIDLRFHEEPEEYQDETLE